MKRFFVLHPFLFAIFPILFLFVHNRVLATNYVEISLLLAGAAFATIVLLTLLTIFVKNKYRAAFIVSFFVIMFFAYGHLYEAAYEHAVDMFPVDRHRHLMPVFALLFATGSFFILRIKAHLEPATRILNTVAITLIIILFANLSVQEFRTFLSPTPERDTSVLLDAGRDTQPISSPDIYYIILDTYADARTLRERYSYDNTPFLNSLTERGFYVATESFSNYDSTNLSLPSSLNMDYLHTHFRNVERVSMEEMIRGTRDNAVLQFLASQGYTTIHFGHFHIPTLYNEYADINIEVGRYGTEFLQLFTRTTMLAPFVQNYFWTEVRYEILEMFDKLAAMPRVGGPKFVFAHILSPHSPFVFGPNGEEIIQSPDELREEGASEKAYLNQLIFVSKKIIEVIDTIVAESETPPIIIVQSDHGPGGSAAANFGILNAYYLPGVDTDVLYPSITPVNSFRVVFNEYFGTDHELLPDRAYVIMGSETEGFDITEPIDKTEEVRQE